MRVLRIRMIKYFAGEAFRVLVGMLQGVSPPDVRKGVMRMKWLDIAIKILHIVAVIGTYAALLEIVLTAIRAILSLFGF